MKLTTASACICLFLIPGLTAADDTQNTSQLWLGLSLMDFQYKEYSDQGELLDREDGLLTGLRVGGEFRQGSLLFNIDFTYQAGTLDYDGQIQTGAPHKTLTNETISELTASLGRRLGEEGLLYMGAGYRQWDRDILPSGNVSGVFERYTWPYAMVGGEYRLWQSGRHRLGLNGRVTYPINPEMTLAFTGYGDVKLNLGVRPGFRLTTPWRIQLADERQLEVAPYVEYWQMGRSSDVYAGNWVIHEPRSETANVGVVFSLGL